MLTTRIPVMRLAAILWIALAVLNAQPVNPVVTVPRTVRYTGSFHPANGLPVQPTEGVTMAVYADQTGGDPLWQETQNVQVDSSGNFAVEMGATQNGGLPLDLLRTGEPRWLGVRVSRPGESEQPRVQLLSVPYALRASDAETLGGIPAAAYLLNPAATTLTASSIAATVVANAETNSGAKAVKPHVTSGNNNYIGLFTNGTDLGNSVLYENGTRIGLNTVNPLDYLHVVFNDASGGFTGYAVQNLGSGAASYSGTLFYDQNGALGQFQGFNNSTHEYRINNIASGGSINFMLGTSKFQVRSDGDINIAGSVRKGGTLFLHNLGTFNTALGLNALAANTTGTENTANGSGALASNTTGSFNTSSGVNALAVNTTGNQNTATGVFALVANTTGSLNAGVGNSVLAANTTGNQNTATGAFALAANTTGSFNTALGQNALLSNTTAGGNTALGQASLTANTTGSNNTASGASALAANTTGNQNTANGVFALAANTTGSFNTALGEDALTSNTTAAANTALGQASLTANTTGSNNTASGTSALTANTAGNQNTATGAFALSANTTGSFNTALGQNALQSNTTAGGNTALGQASLTANTTGSNNTASGASALAANITGNQNTATGAFTLAANTTGSFNTATGQAALGLNTTGNQNAASGSNALQNNTTGSFNTATGQNALMSNTTAGFNTAAGNGALFNSTTGSSNTAIGYLAGSNLTTGSSNIMMGNQGTSSDDHTIRVGDVQTAAFVAGIRGATTGASNAVAVVIDSNGQLGTISSSRRFKEDIQNMGDASSSLLLLRPVTYRYKQPYGDGSKPLDYGLIAEEVAEVYPDLVATNKDGEIETVQYQKLTPMLLNELLKQNQHAKQQDETIRLLEEQIRQQMEQNGKLEERLVALEAVR